MRNKERRRKPHPQELQLGRAAEGLAFFPAGMVGLRLLCRVLVCSAVADWAAVRHYSWMQPGRAGTCEL